jgi:hypothetical protein
MKYSFQKLIQFSHGNNVIDATASPHMGLLREINVFHELSCTGLFGTKTEYLHFGNQRSSKYYFQKLPQFSHGIIC